MVEKAKEMNTNTSKPQIKYGGFWVRVLAYMIDSFVMGLPLSIVYGVMSVIVTTVGTQNEELLVPLFLVSYITYMFLAVIVSLLYFGLMESSKNQATLGKMARGLKVVDYKGQRISFKRAVARDLSKYVSIMTMYVGYFMIGFTDKKQGLHDMIAKTYVVKK